MLRTIFKRAYATAPNRRLYPTTSTSPTPHEHKNIPVASTTSLPAVSAPETALEPQTSPVHQEHSPTDTNEPHQRKFPKHVQDTFPKLGAKRPHLNIPVSPDHGLWHFFR